MNQMDFEHRLFELRRAKGISQEELAGVVGVSRQAVQKWESGVSRPDMDNLVALSEYFDVTLDYLLKGTQPDQTQVQAQSPTIINNYYHDGRDRWNWHFEYKSKRTLFGLPLVHVNLGYRNQWARGIIAVGNIATGFVSLGAISVGLLSVGALVLGALSFGAVSFGLLTWGGLAIGKFAVGGVAIGQYAVGGVAMGGRLAIGGAAVGTVAIGSAADGTLALSTDTTSMETIRAAVEQAAAGLPGWVRSLLLMAAS